MDWTHIENVFWTHIEHDIENMQSCSRCVRNTSSSHSWQVLQHEGGAAKASNSLQNRREPSKSSNRWKKQMNRPRRNWLIQFVTHIMWMNTEHTWWTHVMNASALTCRGGWKKNCGWREKGRTNLTFGNCCRWICVFCALLIFAMHFFHTFAKIPKSFWKNPKSKDFRFFFGHCFNRWLNMISASTFVLSSQFHSGDLVDFGEPEDQCQSWTDGHHPR